MIDAFRNFWRGLQNLWRWTPVIWDDYDWDWTAIARVLEFKLKKHAELEEKYGHHINSLKDAKQMRICAALLRRLQDDNYWENAVKRFGRCPHAAHAATAHQRADQKYLGFLLGKYLTNWWD